MLHAAIMVYVNEREREGMEVGDKELKRKAGAELFVQSYYSSQLGIELLTPVLELSVSMTF